MPVKKQVQKGYGMQYRNLGLMTIFSFISMYTLMYIMVDRFANVYANYNQLYMAALMTIPMIMLEFLFMGSMYPNKHLNRILMLGSAIIFCFSLYAIRKQAGITDRQFLKSMIPHHASALLMCKEAVLQDPELKKLCKKIQSSQQAEIDFMKKKLLS